MIYAIAICAHRFTSGSGIDYGVGARLYFSGKAEEYERIAQVEQFGRIEALKLYPMSEGWVKHSVATLSGDMEKIELYIGLLKKEKEEATK